jgi:cyclohexyl-isocyanide hydratase
MRIAALVYPEMDQMDLTGPFEVLSRLPEARVKLVWKDLSPVRDAAGLVLTPDIAFDREIDPVDVLLVPGGRGNVALMEDEGVLAWLRGRAEHAKWILSVCTGALLLGAAGLLRGRRATTHWNSFELLPYFGAIAEDARVVVDGNLVSAAGVSSGIDGSLRLVAMMAGDLAAQRIQLDLQYAPEPPFSAGSLASAPEQVREEALRAVSGTTERRKRIAEEISRQVATRN